MSELGKTDLKKYKKTFVWLGQKQIKLKKKPAKTKDFNIMHLN